MDRMGSLRRHRSPEILEILLRGGRPWGFTLEGGKEVGVPLYVLKVDPGGKAAEHGQLKAGDILLGINDVEVDSHQAAVDLVAGAFNTLALTVQRGTFDQTPGVRRTPSFTKREKDGEVAQTTRDDSVVYAESKASKQSVRTKPSRRGESFNIRRKNKKEESRDRPTSWHPEEQGQTDKKNKRHSLAALRSGSESRSEKYLAASGDGTMQYSQKPDSLSSHASFHSLHGNATSMASISTQPEYGGSQNSMALSSSLTSATSWHGPPHGKWGSPDPTAGGAPPLQPRNRKGISFDHINHNLTPKAYDTEYKPDYKVVSAQSMHDVRQLQKPTQYSPVGYSPYQSRTANYSRYNSNYENIEKVDGPPGGSATPSPRAFTLSSPSLYKPGSDLPSPGLPPPLPPKDINFPPPKSRPACDSPPAPPVRDASSLRFKSQNHEKYPSWPVAESVTESGARSPGTSRTNSWAPSTTTSQDFPKKPHVYQPHLNPHIEEKSPSSIKKYFEHEKLKTETPFRGDFIQDALARAEGGAFSLHDTSYPADHKGDNEIKNLFNTHYPFPVYDRDGRGKGDKDYTVPSPPERDIPLEKKSGRLWRSETLTLSDDKPATEMPMLNDLFKQYLDKMKSADLPSPPVNSSPPPLPDNPPPPLPKTAPPLPQTAPPPVMTHMAGHQTVTIPRSPQHSSYTYIVRNKPCYNTSTQTECTPPSTRSGSPEQPDNLLYEPPSYRNAEVQCDMDNEYEGKVIFSAVAPSPFSTLERRRTLKSDVSTQVKAVTEALTTWREKEARMASEPPACAPPPVPYSHSREQHRHAPIIDKMEHERRIPETIQEVSQEQSPKRGSTTTTTTPPRIKANKAIEDDILQQIHEHSPSQTSMLRKLSQEFFGQTKRSGFGYTSRLGVHHERGPSDSSKSDHDRTLSDITSGFSSPRQLSLSSQSTSQLSVYPHHDVNNRLSMESTHSSKHSSSDYFSDNEPPSGSREDVTWKGKPAGVNMDHAKPKKTPPSEGRLDRSKKRSLKKAYAIFDEIENFDRPPRRIGSQGKSKSMGNVLVASVTKEANEDDVPVLSRNSSIDNEPPPVNKNYEESVKKLQESPRKIKRTSSEKLRPNKHRQQEKMSADDSAIHKLANPEKRKERRYSHQVFSHRQRHSDPLENDPHRRISDHGYRNSSGSEHRMSSGSDCVFQGYSDNVPASTRSTSSNSSLEERGRNSDPQVKKLQQQALLNFYEKKTGKRLSITSMESTGNVSDRVTPKERFDSGTVSDFAKEYTDVSSNERTHPKEAMDSLQPADRDSSPPPPYESMKKSKSFPRDIVLAAGLESPETKPQDRRRSSGRLDHIHKKGKSAPSSMDAHSRRRSGSLDMSASRPAKEVQPSPVDKPVKSPGAGSAGDPDTSLTLLKNYEYSSSSSSNSSPTKTPTQEFNKYSYQVTVNKNYAKDGDLESPPPVLPPRNYKTSQVERHDYKPPKPLPPGGHGAANVTTTMDYDQTPKADYYADQLRQQARRISSQQSTKLNAARMQYQSKPAELKMTVSVSRPVDRQPTPQEASAPPLYHRSGSESYSPNGEEAPPKPGSSANSENGVEIPVEHITTNGSGSSSRPEEAHKARRPVLEFPSPPPLSQLEAEDLASPGDEPPPVPPPPLPEKDTGRDDPRLTLTFDDPNSANSSPRYPAESYMRYRNSPRQGFSGNYRRSSEMRTPTTPDGVQDAISFLTADSSASSPSQPNDNLVQVTTVTTVNKAMPVAESKVQLEQGPSRSPYSHFSSSGPPHVTQDDSVLPSPTRKHSYGQALVNGAPEDQTESPSVRKFVANFELRQSQENLCESDRPVPPQRTKNKISELKNSLLRKSNESLLDIDSAQPEDRVTENVTIVPNRAEITPTKYILSPSTPSSAERKLLQETHFDVDTTRVETSPIATSSVSSPPTAVTMTTTSVLPEPEPETTSPRTVHQRQKSQEEIDCEQQAAIVAIHVQQEDKRLSDVILPPPEHKNATDYISGLFDINVDLSRSPKRAAYEANSDRRGSFGMRFDSSPASPSWISPGLSSIHSRLRYEGVPPQQLLQELGAPDYSLERQKEELVDRIKRKLEILQDEKKMLKEEISENNSLGKQVTALVQSKCNSRAEFDKYKLYVTEIDKVLYLLLKISSRLARTENSLLTLPDDASEEEQSTLINKQEELQEKLDDAKLLKEGIDRRRDQVATYLKNYLTVEEFADYEHFVKYKSKLTLEVQEIDDQHALGEEQLKALQRSMTCSSA